MKSREHLKAPFETREHHGWYAQQMNGSRYQNIFYCSLLMFIVSGSVLCSRTVAEPPHLNSMKTFEGQTERRFGWLQDGYNFICMFSCSRDCVCRSLFILILTRSPHHSRRLINSRHARPTGNNRKDKFMKLFITKTIVSLWSCLSQRQ